MTALFETSGVGMRFKLRRDRTGRRRVIDALSDSLVARDASASSLDGLLAEVGMDRPSPPDAAEPEPRSQPASRLPERERRPLGVLFGTTG